MAEMVATEMSKMSWSVIMKQHLLCWSVCAQSSTDGKDILLVNLCVRLCPERCVSSPGKTGKDTLN